MWGQAVLPDHSCAKPRKGGAWMDVTRKEKEKEVARTFWKSAVCSLRGNWDRELENHGFG